MVERDLIRVHPGTTARGVADAATSPFPGHETSLRAAADDFDAVRYLGRSGTRERYDMLTELEQQIAATVPATAVAPPTAATPAGGDHR